MLRSIVIFVLCIWVSCQGQEEAETLVTCRAWTDPHIASFKQNPNDNVAEVWCQESGSVTLLENDYIKANIQVSSKPYVITEFGLVFFDDDKKIFCTISETEFFASRSSCGKDVTITRNGNSLIVQYKKRDITVTIQKFNYNIDGSTQGYSITTLQPAYLTRQSTGICKTSCDPNSGKALSRRRRAASNGEQNLIKRSAENVCQTAISKLVPDFKISAINQMNIETKNAYSACVTDVRLTGDITFAKVGVATLAITLATKNLPVKSNVKEIINKANARYKDISSSIDSALAQFLHSTTPTLGKDDLSVEYNENEAVAISCRKTFAGVITIVSASYGSRSTSCSADVTSAVKGLCAKSPRYCQFNVSNTVLQSHPCFNEAKQLKVIYKCVE